MPKRPTKQQPPRRRTHSWAVYHIKGHTREARRIIHNAPDAETAIARAILGYDVPPNESGRLIAQRRHWAARRSMRRGRARVTKQQEGGFRFAPRPSSDSAHGRGNPGEKSCCLTAFCGFCILVCTV
jgi:hypothetical protein